MARQPTQSKREFVELHDRVGRRLMAYFVRRVHDTEAAAELWAECWATAYENWHRCRSTNGPEAEAWVFGIARNLLAGYYRTGAIRLRAMERLQWSVPAVDSALEEELDRIIDRDALRGAFEQALQSLPPMRSTAVRLRVIEDLGYPEVAARLGCSEQAARAHVSRGLKRLADIVDQLELGTTGAATR
jgi:RNA polymerase sigma factor (sigma-70 family)